MLPLLFVVFTEPSGWIAVALSATAAFTGLVLIVVPLVRTMNRNRRLKNPCEVHFVIPPKNREIVHYAEQTTEEGHFVDQLVLRSHTEVTIEVVIMAKVAFQETEWYFGCEGELSSKPRATSYSNPFIIEGLRKEESPKTSPDHYIGSDYYYHIRRSRAHIPGETYVTGLVVETRAPGEYETKVVFQGTERMGEGKLSIKVEDNPATTMRCLRHKECYVKPASRSETDSNE